MGRKRKDPGVIENTMPAENTGQVKTTSRGRGGRGRGSRGGRGRGEKTNVETVKEKTAEPVEEPIYNVPTSDGYTSTPISTTPGSETMNTPVRSTSKTSPVQPLQPGLITSAQPILREQQSSIVSAQLNSVIPAQPTSPAKPVSRPSPNLQPYSITPAAGPNPTIFTLNNSSYDDDNDSDYSDNILTVPATFGSKQTRSDSLAHEGIDVSSDNKRNYQGNQSRVTDLLQSTDSDEDNYYIDHYHEKRTKAKKRQRNIIYEDTNNEDEVSEPFRKRTGKPEALSDMTNVFEVCQWLVKERPDILTVANQMHSAMNTLLDSSTVMSTAASAGTTQITKPANTSYEEKSLIRLWHEEIKCLFLRCREPPVGAVENLVKKIFNYDLYSNEAAEIICHSKRVLTDFRSKLNKKIEFKVREFKEIRTRDRRELAATNSEINEFVSQSVAEQILSRHLSGTNIDVLKACGTMDILVLFVREAFKVHFTAYNVKAIKELDSITIGCKIPSRSGKNIASRLKLVTGN